MSEVDTKKLIAELSRLRPLADRYKEAEAKANLLKDREAVLANFLANEFGALSHIQEETATEWVIRILREQKAKVAQLKAENYQLRDELAMQVL